MNPEIGFAAEIEAMAQPVSWADARARLAGFVARHGLSHGAHLALSPGQHENDSGHVFVTTYPRCWIDRYLTRGYASVDPVLPTARRRCEPFVWSDLRGVDARVDAFFDEAAEMGVGRDGLTIPIHGGHGDTALFSVTSGLDGSAWREAVARLLPLLHVVALEYNRGLTRLATSAPTRDRMSLLTRREIEVLHWAAAGKTVWETAILLGISEQTVQSYLRDAVRRLGCINKTHAVAEAVRQALI